MLTHANRSDLQAAQTAWGRMQCLGQALLTQYQTLGEVDLRMIDALNDECQKMQDYLTGGPAQQVDFENEQGARVTRG